MARVVAQAAVGVAPDYMDIGPVSLGHPIGCSGARILATLPHEMAKRRSRYGCAALCITGGMGIVTAVELL
jgi:acetyl-CoA C-acetyltransferase